MEISELQVPFQARNLMIRITWGREKEIEKVVLRIRVFMYLQLWAMALNLLVKIPCTNEKMGCSCGVWREVHTWIKLYENHILVLIELDTVYNFNFGLEIITEATPVKCQNFVTRLPARNVKHSINQHMSLNKYILVVLYLIFFCTFYASIWRSFGVAAFTLKRDTRWNWVASFTLRPLLPIGKGPR